VYLILCIPKKIPVVEKFCVTASNLMRSNFLTVTNADARYDARHCAAHAAHARNPMMGVGMEDVVDESVAALFAGRANMPPANSKPKMKAIQAKSTSLPLLPNTT
jgi:hypothetical protein